jgi:branched-chain amino acid transport system ATP-binding protein
MLELDGVWAGYDGVPVVTGIDLHVDEGEIVALVGANGVGKSTTVKTICGLIPTMRGTITFRDERIDELAPHDIVRRGIVQVPERRELFPNMSVEENLLLGSQRPSAKAAREETLEWVYELFPRLAERTEQRARTMSGGEQQMLTLGRALMNDPDLVVFDEPSIGLAPQIMDEVFETIVEIHEAGLTVVIIEQNVQQALSHADRGYVMEHGGITMEGSGPDLLRDDRVREAYLGV